MAVSTWMALAVAALSIFAAAVHLYPTTVFDPKELQAIARGAVAKHGDNATRVVAQVIADVRAKYPKHMIPSDEWMFNNAGGAMGSMIVLHASFSECVVRMAGAGRGRCRVTI
jgi:C-8 sterol isomerase